MALTDWLEQWLGQMSATLRPSTLEHYRKDMENHVVLYLGKKMLSQVTAADLRKLYDAIEVPKMADIPCDYTEKMGVPITFLDKYNPEQFEIIGISSVLATPREEIKQQEIRRNGGDRFYYREANGHLKRCYDRIVIRRRRPGHENQIT